MATNQSNLFLVTKAAGKKEPFNPEKVRISLKRAGASEELIQDTLKMVEDELYEGITTKEIYQRIFSHLKSSGTHLATKYSLKQSIMQLGPTGYPFERYLARLLDSEGYKTQVGIQVKGKCVWHEVDVVAEKREQKYMVEAKYHNSLGTRTDTKVALYVYARYLDVSAGDGFTQGWLATNTKLTSDAKIYCECVGLKYLSWNEPEGGSLRERVERTGLYPVTILNSLTQHEKGILLGNETVTVQDLLKNLSLIPKPKQAAVRNEAESLAAQIASGA